MSSTKKIVNSWRSFLNEGVHDLYNDKLILLFGPAGAGKSTAFTNSLKSKGLKYSTPDDIMELKINKDFVETGQYTSIKQAIDNEPEAVFGKDGIRGKSLDVAVNRLNLWKENMLGIVMEGTGGYPDWYEKEIIQPFQSLNYKIMIIMLYVDLDTCLERNVKRGNEGGRDLPPNIVKDIYTSFVDNFDAFKDLATKHNIDFVVVNGTDSNLDPAINYTGSILSIDQANKEVDRFLEK